MGGGFLAALVKEKESKGNHTIKGIIQWGVSWVTCLSIRKIEKKRI